MRPEELLELHTPSPVANSYGEVTVTYHLYANMRAEIVEMRATEQVAKSTLFVGEDVLKLRVRYNLSINRQCRVKWRGEMYNVREVVEDGRKHLMYLTISKVPSGA